MVLDAMEKNEVGEGRESLREVKECNADRVAGEVTLEQRCGGPEGEALRIAGGDSVPGSQSSELGWGRRGGRGPEGFCGHWSGFVTPSEMRAVGRVMTWPDLCFTRLSDCCAEHGLKGTRMESERPAKKLSSEGERSFEPGCSPEFF